MIIEKQFINYEKIISIELEFVWFHRVANGRIERIKLYYR